MLPLKTTFEGFHGVSLQGFISQRVHVYYHYGIWSQKTIPITALGASFHNCSKNGSSRLGWYFTRFTIGVRVLTHLLLMLLPETKSKICTICTWTLRAPEPVLPRRTTVYPGTDIDMLPWSSNDRGGQPHPESRSRFRAFGFLGYTVGFWKCTVQNPEAKEFSLRPKTDTIVATRPMLRTPREGIHWRCSKVQAKSPWL